MPYIQAHGPLTDRIGRDPIRAEGTTVAEVVRSVDRQFPGFATDVLQPDDSARSSIEFAIGERFVEATTAVSEQDLIDVMVSIAGG